MPKNKMKDSDEDPESSQTALKNAEEVRVNEKDKENLSTTRKESEQEILKRMSNLDLNQQI